MRLTRASRLAVAVVLAGACAHNDVVEVITRNGDSTIVTITMGPAGASLPGGTRSVNKFLLSSFDTSAYDAFGRATANPATFVREPPNGPCYGTSPLIYEPGTAAAVPTYTPPNRYLPALVTPVTIQNGGCGTATAYIVPGGHPGNGAGNTFWEFWHDFAGVASTRYVSGLVRYAVQANGALDLPEILQNGTVTTADTLVFMAGDFNPAGRKARDAFVDCSDPRVVQPVAGANPMLLGSDTTRSGIVDIDMTACDTNGVWFNGVGNPKSPVPSNDLTMNRNQYNFFVIWVALPDSTPDYTQPVYRQQIGPLLTTSGQPINNAFAPVPTAALTTTQLATRPGGVSRPDTMRLTFNNLEPLTTGAYQVFLLRQGTDSAQVVTARVIRLKGSTAVDTTNGATGFNTVAGVSTGATVVIDMAPYASINWNAATLAIGSSSGNTTLPTSQPIWTTSVFKFAGQTASTSGNLVFGSFNKGTGPVVFGAAGSGTGGVFGTELREDVVRLARPPLGYMYEAWLINSGDATKTYNLGPILTPYPDLQPLTDADTRQTEPLAGPEITEAAIRAVAPAATFYCDYNRIQIRLAPKANAGTLPATVVQSGASTNPGLGVTCP